LTIIIPASLQAADNSSATAIVTTPVVADAEVSVQQTQTSSSIVCSYHIINRSNKLIETFHIGVDSLGKNQLPFEPLWGKAPQAPPGWFDETLASGGAFSMGWQAKTIADFIKPDQSADFKMELPTINEIQCDKFGWNVVAVSVQDITPNPALQTQLSVSLSNLHITGPSFFEGDVAIRNNGPNDTKLILGYKFGDGVTRGGRIRLMMKGSDAKPYELYVFETGAHAPPSRIDPVLIDLPQQATYETHMKWFDAGSKLVSDTYMGYVYLENPPKQEEFTGMSDIYAISNAWVGTIESNQVSLVIPQKNIWSSISDWIAKLRGN
jgi:hypothetical protein